RINNTAGSASLLLTGTGDVYAYSYVDLLNDTGNKSWNIQHRKAAGFVDDFMIEEYDGAAYYQRFIMRPGGIVGIGTTDFDGTPALGYLTVKGTTNDGTTNIFVGRDSDEANVAYLDTNGNFTLSGSISASASSLPGTTASSFNINSDTNGVILSAPDGRTNAGTFTFPDVAAASKVLTTNMSDAIVAVTLKSDAVNGLNFDSNTLSIDAQNNRVGIGMAAPLHTLDIEGTARVKNSGGIGTLILEGTGDTYKYSALNLFNDTGNKLWAIQHRQVAGEVNNFAIEEYDGVDYTRRLSIIPGGYVGIPDMSPVAQLVIGSDAGASVSGAGSAYIQNNLEVDGTLYAGASTITGTAADTFEVNSDGFGAVISTTNRSTDGTFTFPNVAGAAQVLTNNMSDAAVAVTLNAAADNGLSFDSDTLSIDALNNKVGIGTTSPGERLTVDGGASYSGYVETKSTNANYSGMLFRDADGVQWGLYKNATADPMLQFGRYTDGVWQAAPLSFLRNGDVNFGDRYVGIGDTDPVASLVVGSDAGAAVSGVGSAYVQNNLEVDGTLTAATANIAGTTSDTFTVNSDGTAAASTLALGAAGTTGGSITTGAGNLSVDSAGGTIDINDGTIDLSTQPVDVTLNGAADALNFDSNTLSIDALGNKVGIGTAAPDYLLTIAPPLNEMATIGMLSTSGSGAQINFGYSGEYNAAIGYTQNFEGAIEFKTNGITNADSKMIISSAGKVGIGTGVSTEPAAALDVQASVTAASANAYGARLQQTLTASANSDALNALYINPTFADGGFTGVKHNGIAFPDAQEVKINLGYNAAKSKWLGIDSNWRMAFSDDSGFAFYNSSDNTSWGTEWMRVGGTIEMYSDLLVGTSGTNRWLKMRGNILFEEDDDYIGTYNTGIITLGNLQSTGVATTVNFGRAGGIDVMNFNRGGTTYNFLTLKSEGTDDITLDPAGGDVSVDGNFATTSNGNITAGGSGAVQCGTGAFKSSDGTAGLTGTYNIDGSAAGTIATMQFKNGILVAVTTR
ncbi:MAG: hypothetical protein WC369_05290, partial [Dehalococcoidales bacterium]